MSVRVKYAAVSGVIILVLSGGLTWSFIRQTNRWLVENLEQKELSQVEELALNVTSALRDRDKEGISQLLEKAFAEADVSYVAVFDSKGMVLASRLRRQRLREISRTVLQRVQEARGPTSIPVVERDGQTTYFFVTPVIDIGASSEQRLGAVVLGISSHFLQREIGELVKDTLPISIGALLASCLVLFFLIERSLRPLVDMARLTSKISRGDFSQRLRIKRRDEVGQLANSFNEMVDSLMEREMRLASTLKELETANENLSRLLGETAGLYAALTPLELAETPRQMFERIIDRLVAATGADAVLIRTLDKTAGSFVCPAQRGFPTDYIEATRSLPRGSAFGTVLEEGEPIIAANISEDPRLKGKRQIEAGFNSCALLPLRVKDETRGVIQFSSRRVGYFSEERKEHLMAVARLTGIVVENSELFSEIKAAKEQLEKSSKVKDEFLSVMSHELRTPLNVVVGYAGMIQDRILGEINKEQEDALGKITRQSSDLLAMINSIMEATKMEAGATVVESHVVNLRDFFDELRSNYNFPLGRELTLTWGYPSDSLAMKTDSGKLKQILQNLINNAVKFTKRGRVTISARYLPGREAVEFKVADTGIGIPKEHLPFIFEKFRQVDSSETRSHGGVGLGLFIVKQFAEMLGGKVEVESEPGKGSTFCVTLPREPSVSHQSLSSLDPHPIF